MPTTDVIVIGAGLFGATIARAFLMQRRTVTVFDCNEPLAGSLASGCLMKPSWYDGLGSSIYTPAMAMLADIYKIQDLRFKVKGSPLHHTVHWIPPTQVLDRDDFNMVEERVTAIGGQHVETENGCYDADLIVVAAGFWTERLLPVPGLIGKQGTSFSFWGTLKENFINPWAPYKQVVAFNGEHGVIWAGDGTSILPKNWTEERQAKSRARMQKALLGCELVGEQVGIRPYVKTPLGSPNNKPCLLEQRTPSVWIATGGAKNGMVAAGWCAYKLLEATS